MGIREAILHLLVTIHINIGEPAFKYKSTYGSIIILNFIYEPICDYQDLPLQQALPIASWTGRFRVGKSMLLAYVQTANDHDYSRKQDNEAQKGGGAPQNS